MYTILGASGKTGGTAAAALLAQGKSVRAVGRSAERLAKLVERGAEAAVGDATDADFLARAFAGADGVFVMCAFELSSPDPLGDMGKVSEAVVAAVRRARVGRLVLLSSLGAEREAGTGPIVGLHRLEQALAETGTEQLHLRPGYFYENFFAALPMIRAAGVYDDALAPEAAIPMTATRDIGEAVAAELADGNWRRVEVRELVGEPGMTMPEATTILGRALGRPELRYAQVSDEEYLKGLVGAGLSRAVAEIYLGLAQAINASRVGSREPRSARTTAPTRFADFAPTVAAAYAAG